MVLLLQFLHFNLRKLLLCIFLIILSPQVLAGNSDDLREIYDEIEDELLENIYNTPLYLESEVTKNTMRGDVYGIIYHPYKTVSENLASLTNWCEIMPLHLNIKACTYQYVNGQCKLTFYTGRKFYEKADDVYHLNYQFKVSVLNNDYFSSFLNSKNGPLDTNDYLINVEAIPLTSNSTFFHFAYEYKHGFWSNLAMTTYFSTIGRNKVGFTVKGEDEEGNPLYVKGIRGVVERNSMRYYFAIRSFLDTQKDPLKIRFHRKINNWFDLTENHHRQLYEMDKKDYLEYKNMERQDQIRLQKDIYNNNKKTVTIPVPVAACFTTKETLRKTPNKITN